MSEVHRNKSRRSITRPARIIAWASLSIVIFYLWNLTHVIVVASASESVSSSGGAVLLLGKWSPEDKIDPDFQSRIDRMQTLLDLAPSRLAVLSGGGIGKSEAELAFDALRGGKEKALWKLETASRNTHQNLLNSAN